jgi:cysteine synthase A
MLLTDTLNRTQRIDDLKYVIGNTPLLEIHFRYKGKRRRIYAKAEHFNMTGSIKDRMAYHVLKTAYAADVLKPGDTISEATSGNTGIAFAAIGKALGHPVIIYMPDWMSMERINLIKSFGANIVLVSAENGGFLGSIRMTEELAKSQPHVFLPCQFSNKANVDAHFKTTGPELHYQLESIKLKPDAFVAGVGTGGTVMGVGKYLRTIAPTVKIYPLEPAESPTMTTGYKVGKHRIQGISDEFIPPIVNLKELDQVVSIHDGDAIIIAQQLASQLGIAVGISSGANFLGALTVQNLLGEDAVVTTVFADDNKKYLSTDLMKEEPRQDYYLAGEIELLEYKAIRRVCQVC